MESSIKEVNFKDLFKDYLGFMSDKSDKSNFLDRYSNFLLRGVLIERVSPKQPLDTYADTNPSFFISDSKEGQIVLPVFPLKFSKYGVGSVQIGGGSSLLMRILDATPVDVEAGFEVKELRGEDCFGIKIKKIYLPNPPLLLVEAEQRRYR